MTPCPNWKPKAELKAEHLLGLEDYLLSRGVLGPSPAPGVEKIDPAAFRAEIVGAGAAAQVRVSAGEVRGITPAGQPVVIEAGEPALQALVQVGELTSATLDLFVDVNRRDRAEGDWPEKSSLRAELADPDKTLAKEPRTLYLGRYRWASARQGLEVVTFPIVRRFAAFPSSDAWTKWTSPITKAMEAHLASITADFLSRGAPAHAYCTEMYRLASTWPLMPLNELAAQVRHVRTLKDLYKAPGQALTLYLEPVQFEPPDAPLGENLPTRLASLFGVVEGRERRIRLIHGQQVSLGQAGGSLTITFQNELGAGTLEVRGKLENKLSINGPGAQRPMKREPDAGDGCVFTTRFVPTGPAARASYTLSPIPEHATLEVWYSYA